MPNDLLDAAVDQLRATSAVANGFGDTWSFSTSTGVIKFFADFAADVALPYLVLYEVGERYDYMTASGSPSGYEFTAAGQLACSIFAGPSRYVARQLGQLVAVALDDAALTWTGGTLMALRHSQASFQPIKEVGPGTATVFNRVLIFDYTYSGSIS